MKLLVHAAAVLGCLAAGPASAAITPLAPGQTVPLAGITVDQDASLGGEVPEGGDWLQPFVISSPTGELYSATLQSRVVQRLDTGTVDFYWLIRGVADLSGQVSSIVVTGWGAFSAAVEWRVDGLALDGLGPSDATRTADGDRVGFLFADPVLTAPTESKFMFVRSGVTGYAPTGTARINLLSGESVVLDTWAPVPEPGTAMTLAAAGLMLLRRRH